MFGGFVFQKDQVPAIDLHKWSPCLWRADSLKYFFCFVFEELKGQEFFSDVWIFTDSINSFSVNMDYEHLSVSE